MELHEIKNIYEDNTDKVPREVDIVVRGTTKLFQPNKDAYISNEPSKDDTVEIKLWLEEKAKEKFKVKLSDGKRARTFDNIRYIQFRLAHSHQILQLTKELNDIVRKLKDEQGIYLTNTMQLPSLPAMESEREGW